MAHDYFRLFVVLTFDGSMRITNRNFSDEYKDLESNESIALKNSFCGAVSSSLTSLNVKEFFISKCQSSRPVPSFGLP